MVEFKVNYWCRVESDALLVVEISGVCELCQINLQQSASFSVGQKDSHRELQYLLSIHFQP